MATNRDREIAEKILVHLGFYGDIEMDDILKIIDSMPVFIDEERKEFEQTLHLLDEAGLIKFSESEKQFEGMWVLWKAARGIE